MKITAALVLSLVQMCSLRKQMTFHTDLLELNPKYVVNGTSSMVQDKSSVLINVDFDVILDLRNVTVHVQILNYNDRKFSLVNERMVLCDVLRKKNQFIFQYYVQKIYKVVREHTNNLICIHKVV